MSVDKNNVVTVEYRFKASVNKVFEAIKAGRLLYNCGAWPGGSKIDFRTGGQYRMDVKKYGMNYGEYTEIVENKRIAFTWNNDSMEMKTHVLIELSPDGTGCKLNLRQEGFANSEIAAGHEGGWNSGLKDMDGEMTHYRVKFDRGFSLPVEMLFEAFSGMSLLTYLDANPSKAIIDFKIGGKYKGESKSGPLRGEFLEIEMNKKIVMTWEPGTQVTMEFGSMGDDGKNSYIELLHEGFKSDNETREHHSRWNEVMEKIFKLGN